MTKFLTLEEFLAAQYARLPSGGGRITAAGQRDVVRDIGDTFGSAFNPTKITGITNNIAWGGDINPNTRRPAIRNITGNPNFDENTRDGGVNEGIGILNIQIARQAVPGDDGPLGVVKIDLTTDICGHAIINFALCKVGGNINAVTSISAAGYPSGLQNDRKIHLGAWLNSNRTQPTIDQVLRLAYSYQAHDTAEQLSKHLSFGVEQIAGNSFIRSVTNGTGIQAFTLGSDIENSRVSQVRGWGRIDQT